jgi:hypothetical protein
MPARKHVLLTAHLLALLGLLLLAGPALAQGSVTPSFGAGQLTILGEGYQAGEQVEITVRAGGQSHQFTASADGSGRFQLATGLSLPPLSAVEIQARDAQGQTQVTKTSVPGAGSGAGGGMPLPPVPSDAPPAGPSPGDPTPGGPLSPRLPTQLPRTGAVGPPPAELVGLAGALLLGGLAVRSRSSSSS